MGCAQPDLWHSALCKATEAYSYSMAYTIGIRNVLKMANNKHKNVHLSCVGDGVRSARSFCLFCSFTLSIETMWNQIDTNNKT